MRSALLGLVLVGSLVSSSYGWGYIFSKFRPEASSNWGSYGGAGLGNGQEAITSVSKEERIQIILLIGNLTDCIQTAILQKLSEDDYPDRRMEFCEWATEQYTTRDANFPSTILFSDEAGFYGNGERLTPREQLMEALLGEELLEEEVCNGRRCTSNEHCCPGHVCIDFDSTTGGSCLPVESQREGTECSSDLDCSEGHVCEMGSCSSSTARKGYSEPCMASSECDFGRGLCCQVIRRHRQAPRKMCSYFKDPLGCIGHMESEVKRSRPSQ